MCCDRCKESLGLIKPLNTCNIVSGHPYNMDTYILCEKCKCELLEFLGEKNTNMPNKLEFWY